MSSTRDAPTDDQVTTASRPSFRKFADTQSDFIQPSLACIKPVQVANVDKPNHRVLLLEDSHDDEATMKAKAPIARITLNDCLACAGCITSAESVLITQQSIEEFESMLRASGSKYDLVIVSVSAAARAAIAEHSGLSLRETHSRMAGFLKGLGVHTMLDCGTASNLGLVEQAAEFVARYRVHAAASSPATGGSPMQLVPPPPPSTAFGQGALAAPTALPVRSGAASEATSEAASPIASLAALSAASTSQLPLPLITSSCPGWVCYAEKLCGELVLSHMSSVKSAQQIAGTSSTCMPPSLHANCGLSASLIRYTHQVRACGGLWNPSGARVPRIRDALLRQEARGVARRVLQCRRGRARLPRRGLRPFIRRAA